MSGLPDEFVPDEPVRIGTPDPADFTVSRLHGLKWCMVARCGRRSDYTVADKRQQTRFGACTQHVHLYRDADRFLLLDESEP
jgi:hypothetical protein